MSRPQSIQECFDSIDELDTLAQFVLTEHQLRCWNLLTQDKDCKAIAAEMGLAEVSARQLRARVQQRVRQAQTEKHEGRFRVGITVQKGSTAEFQEDSVAREAIENASRRLPRAA